ncbi:MULTISPECIES: glycoside hydrolase family 10 protein [Calothrix]|uniref:Family 10 glycosylhydrolase n=2 Tax=Calothrix TaxID=1186 RepID=A0ABR8ACD7_9CYAN|nr:MULTISPECIES: family 10 glycosylhydrolase [Calothrix]MBD2196988.1 family 10 glycosylhydrolase [Calothrix parietina FACHB-288]MBD2225540.1 family 10 glycosylhydrolase [Calothrix anomala FACHB-343]
MSTYLKATFLSGLLLLVTPSVHSTEIPQPQSLPPAPAREFRGVWIASVANIDWPSRPGLTTTQQQAELIAMLDRAAALKLNAVILQVRPAADALYASSYEPWSEFLTGEMGKAPTPDYDPLAFAVEEAHKRGIELHAWFNPFRARHPQGKSPVAANHVSKLHPQWVKKYGKYLWLDPGEAEVQDYTVKVIMDVVKRYDIDAVHLDDYFYPYPERSGRRVIDFPDTASWQKYQQSGGKLNRDDWRRENINTLVQRLYQEIKQEKPWVKFGISPFGVWRPGYPAQISKNGGFDPYQEIYADSRQWLVKGWIDYFAPQLYWKIEKSQQSYPVLLNWWLKQNPLGRHIWPGNFTSRVGDRTSAAWPANEILYQIKTTRGFSGATGNIHYSMKPLMQNRDRIVDILEKDAYPTQALIPASPWLDKTLPTQPTIQIERDTATGKIRKLTWQSPEPDKVWLWVMQTKSGNRWTTQILPRSQTSYLFNSQNSPLPIDTVAVSAVNRYSTQGQPAIGN